MTVDIFPEGTNQSVPQLEAMVERAERHRTAGSSVRIWNVYGDRITIIGGPSPLGWRFRNGEQISDLRGVFLG